MPQHKSAKKRMKTSLERRDRNRAGKSTLKTALKKYKSLDEESKKQNFSEVQSKLDVAAKKGFIKKRKAARLKSRLTP